MTFERGNIRRMTGYAYGEQPDDASVIKLNTNENPLPPSPAVAKALAEFDAAGLRRYPPATAREFRLLAARRLGVDAEQIVVTNGGDEALRLAVTTFVDPGGGFGTAAPSYSLYPVLGAIQDCRMIEMELADDWTPPPDLAARLNAEGASLTCLVNPHAPSGALLDEAAVTALAGALDGVLLVDEAYVDFVDPELGHDLTGLVRRHDNLLLLRTLSKGYSLAGLRFGFLVGGAGLIGPIRDKTRDSYNVGSLAQTLAAAAFGDAEYAASSWELVRRQRRELKAGLEAMGFEVAPSQANFLLARPPAGAPDAAATQGELRQRGVLVRHFDRGRLAAWLRITVGSPAENRALLAALATITGGGPC